MIDANQFLEWAQVHGHYYGTSRMMLERSSGEQKDLILDALKTTHGNRAKAAKLLQTTERIMGYKVKKYTINWQRFRS